jgi:DNA modification methylase
MALKPSNSQTKPSPTPRVEWAPVETLRPNPKNARTHSKKQIRQIAWSIRQFGFLNPAIVDDENMILAGHGRFEAARLEGLTDVPVLRFNHLTEAEKRAYAIADNRITERAGWDRQLLSVELGELVDLLPIEGLEISLTGFEIPEIELLVASRAKPRSTPEDVVPQPPLHAVTRPGDLWLLGDQRLLCGDARSAVDFGRLMEGTFAAAVFCTPPSMLVGSAIRRGGPEPPGSGLESAEMSSEQYREFLLQTLGNAAGVSSEGAIHFVCTDWRRINDLIEAGRTLYGEMLSLVVWDKSSVGPGWPYRSQHEPIGVFQVGRQLHQNNTESRRFGRNRSDVWTYPVPRAAAKNRVAARAADPSKPLALVADALLDCTAKGEIVLDPFAGSGATILASEKIARAAYALEREARFVDVAIQRWRGMTKREPILAGDGRGFAAVAEARASLRVAPCCSNEDGEEDTRANGECSQDSEVAAETEGRHA